MTAKEKRDKENDETKTAPKAEIAGYSPARRVGRRK